MGRYAILLVLATLTIISPFVESSRRAKLEAVDDMSMRYEIRNLQNIATSYAAMNLYLVTEAKNDGDFKTSDFEYTTQSTLNEDTTIKVSTTNLAVGVDRIDVVASKGNIEGKTSVQASQIPFTYYAQFLNSFNNLYYGTGERITGPVHINGRLGVGQVPGPIFDGNITTMGSTRYYAGANASNYKGFLGDGIDENHREISIPNHLGFINKTDSYDLNSLFPSASKVYIEFGENKKGESRAEVYDVPYSDPNLADKAYRKAHRKYLNFDTKLDQDYRVLYTNREIHLKGTLTGKLTIASENDIYIDDDVLYKNDPRIHSDSKDLLGIVSANDIIISSGKIPYGGYNDYFNPDGITLMAAIFTLGTIEIENLSNNWVGPYSRGDWTTIGSRLQDYPSATWNGSYNYKGFKEVIDYDTRLRYLRPPGIPFTNEQKTTRWKESFVLK